jgi:serine/threonine protein kinase
MAASHERPTRFGDYVLLRRVAAGGMGEVYRAQLRGVGGFTRELAIKRLLQNPEHGEAMTKMLLDEARVTARLVHPHIAQMVNCGAIGAEYFIAMEYVDGPSLSRILQRAQERGSKLPVPACLHIGLSLLRALAFAHRQTHPDGRPMDIVHRDVSPQNVLVSYSGDVKLIDFGVVRSSGSLHSTATGLIRGKLAYMPPEQLRAERLDHRADQYAAVVVILEAIAARRMFAATNEIDLLRTLLERGRPAVAEMLGDCAGSAELEPILARALDPDPAGRFADCDELADALAAVARDLDVTYGPQQLGVLISEMFAAEKLASAQELARTEEYLRTTPSLEDFVRTIPLTDAGTLTKPLTPTPVRVKSWRGSIAAGLGLGAIALGVSTWLWITTAAIESGDAAAAATPRAAVAPPPSELKAPGLRPPAARPAPKRAESRAPVTPGQLEVACLPWCEIYVDDDGSPRQSPLRKHTLPSGPHQVRAVHPTLGLEKVERFTLEKGEQKRLVFRFTRE